MMNEIESNITTTNTIIIEQNNEKKITRNLSSFECHEISRLYKHLTKVTSGTILSPSKRDTAINALDTLNKKVAYVNILNIRPVDDTLELFSLESFKSLEELSLNKCPPSTIIDFYDLRNNLRKLEIISAGIPELSKLFAPIKRKYLHSLQPMILSGEVSKIKPIHLWNKLTTLRMTNCGITRMDSSLHMLPALTYLDISYNNIPYIIHLHDCIELKILNISYNRISVLSNLIWIIPNIQRLNLSHNQIESLDGLDKLQLLQKLDISYNKISDFQEVQILSGLQFLTHIYLVGNPISLKPNYRLHVTSQFLNDCALNGRDLPSIDGKILSPKESYTLKSTIFLPPEIAIDTNENNEINGYTTSRKRLGILIGNIAVYGDDIPIRELDIIFDAEAAKFKENNNSINPSTNNIDDKFSETSSVVHSPVSRITSNGKQYILESPSSTSNTNELLTKIHTPKSPEKIIKKSKFKSKLKMLPKQCSRQIIEVIEEEDITTNALDISSTFNELYRLGVVDSLPNSPYKYRLNSVNEVSSDVKLLLNENDILEFENDEQEGEVKDEVISNEQLLYQKNREESKVYDNQNNNNNLRKYRNSNNTTNSSSNTNDTNEPNRDSSSDISSSPLKPFESIYKLDDQYSISPIKLFETSKIEENMIEQKEEKNNEEEIILRESDISFDKKSSSSRWLKSKNQFNVSNNEQNILNNNNSVPSLINPLVTQLSKSEGIDSVSLNSSEELPTSIIKSSSSVVKSHEPENLEDLSEMKINNSDIKIPIPSYTGSEEFVYLSISDNLEKYFTEQVFGHGRPSGDAPYMRYEILNGYDRNINGYIEVPYQQERVVALYREKAIEIHENNSIQKINSNSSDNKRQKKNSKSQTQSKLQSTQSQPLKSYVFVLTDINFYVIIDNFSSLQKFVDAPIPIVKRALPVENCRSCTLYFGFQRCSIHFFDESLRNQINYYPLSYMIVTKDKSRTHPIITTIPTISNIQRELHDPPLSKVFMTNKDSQLLDCVAEMIHSLGGTEINIIFSQLLSQIWKQTPGYSVPRTLILTPKRLLLCDENLSNENVELKLLDSVLLKDIFKIRSEDDPLKLTLIMKPQSKVSLVKRKWRLLSDSALTIVKITDELRRASEG